MQLNYYYAESTVEPIPILIEDTIVRIRKDIATENRTDKMSGSVTTFYTYQEAKLTHEEFKTYSDQQAAINAITGSEIAAKQTVMMSAIADLYDMISALKA